MSPTVERLTENLELGEGPHWDAKSQVLYFVDIFGNSIHKYDPSTKTHTKAVVGDNNVSLIIPVEGTNDKFLISENKELVIVTWDGKSDKVASKSKVSEVKNDSSLSGRFNDGKTDPSGRLWAGTMGGEPVAGKIEPNKGALYSLQNGQLVEHVKDVWISNGLAFNTELKKFYYIDSPTRQIVQYDFNIENGIISNRQVVFSLDKHSIPGFPDGQCIDTDGNLWIACFNGYRIIKIDPRVPETLLQTIEIPAKQVTSVAFGGSNLDELYVTTAGFTVDFEVLPPPNHGALYKVTGTGSKGVAGYPFKA